MTEELTIQCDNCGTLYSSLEEVCPYCGQPQPFLSDDLLPLESYDDPAFPLEEEFLENLYDETQPQAAAGMSAYDIYSGAEDYLDRGDDYAPEGFAPTAEGFTGAEEYGWLAGQETYEQDYEPYEEYGEYDEPGLLTEEIVPRRFTWKRLLLGCVSLFTCIGLLYGTVAVIAAYHGLRERALNTQAEAEQHFQKGQKHLANEELDLAIAEFEMALSLNPNLLPARQALRDTQGIAQKQPTPTSETRSAAAAALLQTAETQVEEENWFDAVQTLSQVRDLDADYQKQRVSELLYTASYQLGLQLITPDRVEEAALSFERALNERPDDTVAKEEMAKASLYIEGKTATEDNDWQKAVDSFSLLHRRDPAYLDVQERLVNAHGQLGDKLASDEDWCLAEVQYVEATDLQTSDALEEKVQHSKEQCQASKMAQTTSTPPPRATAASPARAEVTRAAVDKTGEITPTTAATATTPTTAGGRGSIVFSAYNPAEKRWEILAVPVTGGTPQMLVPDGTMPAVSPNGQMIVYHSELLEAEGFHRFDLTTGQDARITQRKNHILPRWAGDNKDFLFVAQELGTGRWQIFQGFADGKSDPIILRDGRTADWSPDKSTIAYQGTDPQGNQPGIYLSPFGGGEATRVTGHESDRAPDFSPDGSRLAYMSTQDGSWNIYTVGVSGGQPFQVTRGGGSHGLPTWSPDGSQIAYVSDADGSWAIYVVDANGGTPAKVTAWDGNRTDWLLAQIDWIR